MTYVPHPLTPERRREIATLASRAAAGSGGRARAAKLSPERRSEIARKAARARWGSGAGPRGRPAGGG